MLEPASVDDIVRLIDFAGRHGISVAARGQGHAAFGQSQVRGGVVIDMARLARVHSVGHMSADVDAWVTWRAVLDKTLSRGLVPRGNTELLAGLRDVRGEASIADMAFEAYAERLDPIVAAQKASGDWQRPHPWFDVRHIGSRGARRYTLAARCSSAIRQQSAFKMCRVGVTARRGVCGRHIR